MQNITKKPQVEIVKPEWKRVFCVACGGQEDRLKRCPYCAGKGWNWRFTHHT
jgi:RNase P subunit RPR2